MLLGTLYRISVDGLASHPRWGRGVLMLLSAVSVGGRLAYLTLIFDSLPYSSMQNRTANDARSRDSSVQPDERGM